MKDIDFAYRRSPFVSELRKPNRRDWIVCEVGVSAGAHAHAILKFCPIYKLYLVDPFDEANGATYWFCVGRLSTRWFSYKTEFITKESLKAVGSFEDESLDAIYFDQKHEYEVVRKDLLSWWPKLKSGGIIGHRNYGDSIPQIKRAVDEFVNQKDLKTFVSEGEIIIYK